MSREIFSVLLSPLEISCNDRKLLRHSRPVALQVLVVQSLIQSTFQPTTSVTTRSIEYSYEVWENSSRAGSVNVVRGAVPRGYI